jgi:serine/threonine-protein kinase SRPK3
LPPSRSKLSIPRANFFADLSVRNLALNSTRLSHFSEEELFRVLGLPKSEELIRLDGKPLGEGIPSRLVKSVEWIGWPDDDDDDDDDIRIIDLGEAFTQDTVPEKLAQPPDLQVPETIFTDRLDYRLDLWRAGLIVRFPPLTL